MSIEHLAIVLHHSKAKGTDKVILLGIANHDGDHGAYPGIPTLAKYANVAESSAREAVRRLEACPGDPCPTPLKNGECPHLGEVAVRVGAGPLMPNGGRTNRYDLLVSCPPECDRTPQHRLSTPTAPPVGVDNSDPHRPTGATPHRPTGATPHRPTGAEPSLEPSKNPPPTPTGAQTIPGAVVALWEGEGINEDERRALWASLVADPQTIIPARRATQSAWYVPAVAAIRAQGAKDIGAAVHQLRQWGPDCDHGQPGGAALHPTTGLPLCPLCRRGATA